MSAGIRSRLVLTLLFLVALGMGSLPEANAQSNYATPYTFTTLSGSGFQPQGSADGIGSAASFNLPLGVAVDSSGNVYVADTYNHKIRKITAAGVVTTLAGSGSEGSADGTGGAASFGLPSGVAVDVSGNVYVADTNQQKIRKITSGGVVTTLAGSGSLGSADGTGSAASFRNPRSVAVDNSGNVYVADGANYKIRKITAAGVVTTLAGSGSRGSADGSASVASFGGPGGVAVDSSGNVYVADTGNDKIRKITAAGVVTTLAGSGSRGSTDGSGTVARFYSPLGVTVDSSGNVYVADTGNQKIRKVTAAGVVSTFSGSGLSGSAEGTGNSASFYSPNGVAVDSSGNIYVADTSNNRIRKITTAGVVSAFAGINSSMDGTGSAANFNRPQGVAVDGSGNVYVADTGNHKIRKITAAGVVTTFAGSSGIGGSADGTGNVARFRDPQGVAVDGNGNVYVADTGNNVIRKITPGGLVTTLAGSAGNQGSADGTGSAASFNFPYGVAVDGSGNLYVAEIYSNLIRKITATGVVTTFAGSSGIAGSTDGTGNAARFRDPQGVAVDGSGNVYVADTGNQKIRKITQGRVVTTLAGSGSEGSADGTGIGASFSWPVGVAVDSSGSVYVSDGANYLIRKITAAGQVTTLAGSAGSGGSADGTGSAARFIPYGVAVDSSGNVYVTSYNKISKGALFTGPPPSPAIAVSGNSILIANGDITPANADFTDFGTVAAASGIIAKTFAISNSGTAALNLTGTLKVALSGSHASNFSVTLQPSSPVAVAGGSTTFTFTFDPSAIGLRTATVSIANDDPTKNPFTFSIQGTGLNTSPVVTSHGGAATALINVAENSTTVATVTATDPDLPAQTLSYSITGGADAAKFIIGSSSGEIAFVSAQDFESPTDAGANNAYDLTVTVTDNGAPILSDSQAISVTITNVNETPSNITLSASSLAEDVPANTMVGNLSTVDPDSADSFTYSLVSGSGSSDNSAFTITGATLKINSTPVFATQSSYAIRIRSTDSGGLFLEKPCTITVTGSAVVFTDWAATAGLVGLNAALTATPFNDGVPNLLKYAFNMNAGGADVSVLAPGGSSGLPQVLLDESGEEPVLKVEFLRRKGSGLVYTPERAASLDAFTAMTGAQTVTPINSEWERVSVIETNPPTSTSSGFARVRVTIP